MKPRGDEKRRLVNWLGKRDMPREPPLYYKMAEQLPLDTWYSTYYLVCQ